MTENDYKEVISKQEKQLAALTKQNTELAGTIGRLVSCPVNKLPPTIQHKYKGEENEMRFYVPKGCSFFQRNFDGRWEARIMIDGKQQFIATSLKKQEVYDKLMKAYKSKNKSKVKTERDFTLHSWLDHWHTVYRKPKEGKELSKNTILSDKAYIKKIKTVFKDMKLRDLTADLVQQKLYSMTEGRTCEGVYTILKMAMEKAKDRTGGMSIMSLVEKVKHKRVRGRALNKDEITTLLEAAHNDVERDVIRFYINTGCRVDEISATKVNYINLTSETKIITNLTDCFGQPVPDMPLMPNEILIHGTKTKLSLRTMPIMPPLKPILERLIKDREGEERLFPYTTVMIRNFHTKIKEKLIAEKKEIKFTLKDFRHTAATNFKDAGIPSSVYFRWFGWSDDTMAKRVYTHETEYEKKVSQEWAQKFNPNSDD